MHIPSSFTAVLLLASSLGAHAQTNVINYVDADLSNTTIAGAAPSLGVNYASPNRVNGDNLWDWDNNDNFANPPIASGTIWTAGTSDTTVAELETTITGLTPGATYEIYAFGWTAGTNWDMAAGLTSGSLTDFRDGPAGDYYPLANRFTTVGTPVTITTSPAAVDGEIKTFTPAIEVSEGNRAVYMVQLGSTTANGSGEITIYIDNYAGGDRTWFDGVGWELIPPPNPDTDMDGLTDIEETSGSQNPFGPNDPTNPNDDDSDNDGFLDGAEVFGTPPTDPNDINSFPVFITFVNATPNTTGADGNTTLSNGSLMNLGTDFENYPGGAFPPNPGSLDGKWNMRSTFANNGEIFGSGDVGSEDCPILRTTLTALTPNAAYELYGYYWAVDTGSQAWQARFGRSSSMMTVASPGNSTDLGAVTPSAYFTNSPDLLVQEGNRELYEFPLGIGQANGSGEIELYADDVPESSHRSWFDGFGHRPSNIDLSPGTDDDSDGLDNVDEVNTHFTNPAVADTDGDGINDGTEVTNGTDPLDGDDPPFSPGDSLEIAPDGAWTWFNDERNIWHLGKLYSGYVLSNGQYGVSQYDPATNTSSHSIISDGTSQQPDDHNNPSITVLPDNKLLLVYSKHGADDFYYHRTSLVTEPSAIGDWGPQIQVDTSPGTNGGNNTYANTYRLSAESDLIYLFHRQINFNPTVTLSADNGATWGTPQHFIDTGTNGSIRPYPRYCSNNVDRIDLIYTDGHPRNENNSVYHMFYNAGDLRKTDGSLIDTFANLPLDHDAGERGTEVYSYSSAAWSGGDGPDDWIPNGRGWTWDVHYGSDGNPVCVFQVQVDNVTGSGWNHDRIYYYYARWTGTNWQRKFIAQGGRGIYSNEDDYGGGMSIDPDNPNVIYISSNAADPFDLASISAVPLGTNERYEIYRGVTDDGGLTFTWEALTANSPKDNFRPVVPAGHGYDKHAIWFYGDYFTFTNFQTKVVGLFTNNIELIDSVWSPTSATFTWKSEPGATYDIKASLDLTDFDIDTLLNIPSQGATTTQFFNFPAATLSQDAAFFRVEKQP